MNLRIPPHLRPIAMLFIVLTAYLVAVTVFGHSSLLAQVNNAASLGTSLQNNADTVRQILVNFLQRALVGIAVVLLVLALITGFFRHQYVPAIWEGVGAIVAYVISALINTLS